MSGGIMVVLTSGSTKQAKKTPSTTQKVSQKGPIALGFSRYTTL